MSAVNSQYGSVGNTSRLHLEIDVAQYVLQGDERWQLNVPIAKNVGKQD